MVYFGKLDSDVKLYYNLNCRCLFLFYFGGCVLMKKNSINQEISNQPKIEIIENNIIQSEIYKNIFSNQLFAVENEESSSQEFKIDNQGNLIVNKELYDGNTDSELSNNISELVNLAGKLNKALNQKYESITHKTIMDIYDLYAKFRYQCAKTGGLIKGAQIENKQDDIYNYHKYKSDIESVENYSLLEKIMDWTADKWKNLKDNLGKTIPEFIKKIISSKKTNIKDVKEDLKKSAKHAEKTINDVDKHSTLEDACKRQLALIQANEVFFKNLLLKSYNQTFLDKFNNQSINDIFKNSKEFQVKYIDTSKLNQPSEQKGAMDNTFSLPAQSKLKLISKGTEYSLYYGDNKIANFFLNENTIDFNFCDGYEEKITYEHVENSEEDNISQLKFKEKSGQNIGTIEIHKSESVYQLNVVNDQVVNDQDVYFIKTGNLFLNSKNILKKPAEKAQEQYRGNYYDPNFKDIEDKDNENKEDEGNEADEGDNSYQMHTSGISNNENEENEENENDSSYRISTSSLFKKNRNTDEINLIERIDKKMNNHDVLKTDSTDSHEDNLLDMKQNTTLIDQASAGCFMAAVDKFLGFNILVDTELIVTQDGYAVLMKSAEGTSVADHINTVHKNIRSYDFNKDSKHIKKTVCKAIDDSQKPLPSLQEQAIMLNILDYICGNRDRHPGNFFVNGWDIKGIDNEWCMPVWNQSEISGYHRMYIAKHLKNLIPVVTKDIKDKVDKLVDENGNLSQEMDKLAKIFIKTKSDEDLNSVINSMKQRINDLRLHLNSKKIQVVDDKSKLNNETAKKIFEGSTKYKANGITTMGTGIVFAAIEQINNQENTKQHLNKNKYNEEI